MAYKRQSPDPVVEGGSGVQTATAYAVLCGGTTATNPFQSIAGVGTAGQILTSNGAAALPTFQNNAGVIIVYADVNTTPYVTTATDEYLSVDTSALAITINMPNAPTTNRTWTIKDRTGAAATRNITVTSVGGVVLFDGAATYTMNTNFQAIDLLFNGVSYEVF